MNKQEAKEKIKDIFDCDRVRILQPSKTYFAVIGNKTSTKSDEGKWVKDGLEINFEYFDETIVGSGSSIGELVEDARGFKELENKSTMEYLKEKIFEDTVDHKRIS